MAIKQWEGVLTHVDENGDLQELFPIVKTDKSLTVNGKPADAAAVGYIIKEHGEDLKNIIDEDLKTIDEDLKKLDAKITPQEILLADYNNLSEAEKKNGVYIIVDASVTDLSGSSIIYTGTREGLGTNFNEVIDTVDGKVETVEERLTASNNTKFRFDVNGNNEYGYVVTDSEGADTFHPFKKGYEDTPATATAAQITAGYTAWVNGVLITGTRVAPIGVLTGSFSVGNLARDAVYTKTVTFSTPFDSVPTVKVTATHTQNSESHNNSLVITTSDITRTGFTVTFKNSNYYNVAINNINATWEASA